MGGWEALAGFLTLDGAWAPGSAVVGVGLQEEKGNIARTGWHKSCTFLARGESLWMRKSQEATGRVACSLPMGLQNLQGNHMLILDMKPDLKVCKNKANKQNPNVLNRSSERCLLGVDSQISSSHVTCQHASALLQCWVGLSSVSLTPGLFSSACSAHGRQSNCLRQHFDDAISWLQRPVSPHCQHNKLRLLSLPLKTFHSLSLHRLFNPELMEILNNLCPNHFCILFPIDAAGDSLHVFLPALPSALSPAPNFPCPSATYSEISVSDITPSTKASQERVTKRINFHLPALWFGIKYLTSLNPSFLSY